MGIILKIYVVKFQDSQYLNIYLIHNINQESKKQMVRKIKKNIRKICPFLKADMNFQIKGLPSARLMEKLIPKSGRNIG